MTNKEKLIQNLKEMTEEDLAEFIANHAWKCSFCIYDSRECVWIDNINCEEGITHFLNKEIIRAIAEKED